MGEQNHPMAVIAESDVIKGVYVVEPVVFGDDRGFFVETYRREWFPLGREMLQGNRGDRQAGAVVGLHYHLHQADYWYVPEGRARVVLHDLRAGSPTDGATLTLDLGREPDGSHTHRGVFIPPGVAHGFGALTAMTITYLVDSYYNPADELGVAWDDPEVGADWGVESPILSNRDQTNPRRAAIEPMWQPHFALRT
jgi:dTDP-4-dehydrorhamnose 3,5-epimerase